MMSSDNIRAELLVFTLNHKKIGVLRINAGTRLEICLCFSKSSALGCLEKLEREGFVLTNLGISSLLDLVEYQALPEFDQQEAICFGQRTSATLSPAFDVLADLADDPAASKSKLQHFVYPDFRSCVVSDIDSNDPLFSSSLEGLEWMDGPGGTMYEIMVWLKPETAQVFF